MPWTNVKLNDGRHLPGIGFGSSGHPKERCADDMVLALDSGFEHIDTAQIYKNEQEVGDGLKLSHLPRDEFWLTTKWSGLKPIKQSMQDSLDFLGLEYVDLYLIHNPRWVPDGSSLSEAWNEMREVRKEGWAKSIGVSNFSVAQLKEILADGGSVPAVNQILFHPTVLSESEDLLAFHHKHGIVTEGYSPLKPLRDGSAPGLVKVVDKIAKEHKVQPDQVLLAWSKALGVVPITTSQTESRIRGYIAAGDLKLSDKEVKAISKAGKKASDSAAMWGKARWSAMVMAFFIALVLVQKMVILMGQRQMLQ